MISPKGLATLMSLVWLGGCAVGGAPPTRYTLPDDAATPPAPASGAEARHQLTVRPLRLTRYLDVEGIVFQLDDITLQEASGHQWVEPLGRQLERGLRERLAHRLPETRVMLEADAGNETSQRLRVEVERFQGRHDGLAVTEGRWQLRDADGRLLVLEPFRVTTPLAADGYPALVRALGHSWDGVADEIAAGIRRLR
ncbi:PqiC family protein [Halomonas nitroreducens]|uniref:ABC-type transport auxiliary lipoprotein component domain-containing protein n=1 Tax=Halomonas nitroreducens TaxID=447425 RepID=A0A431V8B5_9GAMM|nr:ABC-type transport auxiliary lipoprotein family protein [Halomonas nitroreducens]RTR06358.1 hypothetical protein EKG36_02475 [Halomonas nitroreducens]